MLKFLTKLYSRIPLKTLLIVPFVLQISAAVGVVGYLSWKNGQKAVDELANQLLTQVSARVSQHLDSYLSIPYQINQTLTDTLDLGVLSERNLELMGELFWKQFKTYQVSYINYGNEKGEYVGAGYYIEGEGITVDEQSKRTNWIANSYRVNKQGHRLKLIKVVPEYNFKEEQWYSESRKRKKILWTSPYTWDDGTGNVSIAFSSPLLDNKGNFKGALAIDLLLSSISQFLSSIKLSPSSQMFIVDRQGLFIASSSHQHLFTTTKAISKQISVINSSNLVEQEIAKKLHSYYQSFQNINHLQRLKIKINQKNYYVLVNPWQDKLSLNWLVVIIVPESDFMGQIQQNNYMTIILCIFALGVAILFGIYSSQWVINPILKLKSASLSLANGHFQQIVDLDREDELGVLANTFNTMAKQLQLSFSKLEEKNRELQRLDELKDEFIANTSHELKTPLNGIIGLAESLVDGVGGELSEKAINDLALIIFSGRRLANLINDILDFSKLKHKNIELQIKSISVREIVDVVLSLLQPLITKKSLEIINTIPDNMPLVLADENRLQQILYNLLGNAIKFTEKGAIRITTSLVDRIDEQTFSKEKQLSYFIPQENRKYMKISIADTGIGIPEDKLDTIFESFEQGDGSTAREFGGTGLGLAVTKKLVELHEGVISVQSTLGEGSKFSFLLPLSQETVSQNLIQSLEHLFLQLNRDDTIATVKDSQGNGFKILVVDDEPINLQVLINYLSLQNYQIVQANNGFEALEIINNDFKPDLVLLDVMMPKMTGYEVCKRIRQTYSISELPIVMLTAKNQIDDLVEGFSAGANDYLTKPFNKSELLARITTHLNLAKINSAYEKFVPQGFLTQLGRSNIIDVKLGDQVQRKMSVLFSDIRSFTTLSEQMTPEENFKFINDYLGRVSPIIREYNGFIDKYIGDAIMALFPESVDTALQSAITMQRAVAHFNKEELQQKGLNLEIGIGLHYGTLMLGTIGESERMESTVISDTVNLASRLEELTKVYGANIIISQVILSELEDYSAYQYRFLDQVRVKGKQETVAIFDVYDADTLEIIELKNKTHLKFETAIVLYYQNELANAQKLFSEVLEVNPFDKTALLYLKRCQTATQ